jgi:prepilin-type N-terminal cleavage/methylation domain-containing protein
MNIKKLQALKSKRAFTLVELIVVIAIIAILAAILIPLLVNHVRSGRCSQALADAKSAHNVAADHAATLITNNSAHLTEAELQSHVDSQGSLGDSVVVITLDNDTLNITATVDSHTYSSGGGTWGCGWLRCPAGPEGP